MKWLRVAALGLVVGLCVLTAAPAAGACGYVNPVGMCSVFGVRSDRVPGWLARAAAWLGWGEGEGELRKVVAGTGSCVDPGGAPKPCPTSGTPPVVYLDSDTGSCVDPGGNTIPCVP